MVSKNKNVGTTGSLWRYRCMYKEKNQKVGFQKDFEIVFEKSYEFIDPGACEAGVSVCGAVVDVATGCVAVERFFS